MQRITNCIVKNDKQILLLQKPSKNWWVAPGGKMEHGESIKESVTREFREETGLHVENPKLKGIFTMVIKKDDQVVNEWMMFTFLATKYHGTMLEQSPEGKLEWKELDKVKDLQMAPGDVFIFEHILQSDEVLFGTFYYTEDYQLISYRLDC